MTGRAGTCYRGAGMARACLRGATRSEPIVERIGEDPAQRTDVLKIYQLHR